MDFVPYSFNQRQVDLADDGRVLVPCRRKNLAKLVGQKKVDANMVSFTFGWSPNYHNGEVSRTLRQ